MSVGHVARILEEAGIATVVIAVRAFRRRLQDMSVLRLLVTDWPMGRPIGPPGASEWQRRVVAAALRLLHEARGVGTVVEFPEPCVPHGG